MIWFILFSVILALIGGFCSFLLFLELKAVKNTSRKYKTSTNLDYYLICFNKKIKVEYKITDAWLFIVYHILPSIKEKFPGDLFLKIDGNTLQLTYYPKGLIDKWNFAFHSEEFFDSIEIQIEEKFEELKRLNWNPYHGGVYHEPILPTDSRNL